MEREKARRNWRTVCITADGTVENVKTNQTKAEADLCLAESRLVNYAGTYEIRDDWIPRAEREMKGQVVSVIMMGASVGIWNVRGDVIKRFGIDEKLRENVTAYLKEMNFLVDNASSFDGWLDEFKKV